jgi:hypothetical protein
MEKVYYVLAIFFLLASCLLVGMAWIKVGALCPIRYLHYFVATPFFFILIACLALKIQKAGFIETIYNILNRPLTTLTEKLW